MANFQLVNAMLYSQLIELAWFLAKRFSGKIALRLRKKTKLNLCNFNNL